MRRLGVMLMTALTLGPAAFLVRPAAADDASVSIVQPTLGGQYAFSPSTRSVNVGDRVTWVNNTSTTHTVTSDSTGPLDSGNLGSGQTYSHTFVKEGTFAYHCDIHSYMHGTIIVSESTTTQPTVASTTTTRLTTTTRPSTTTSKATTSTTGTIETLDLETTSVPEEATTTTAGQVAIKTNNGGGTNGAAVAILVLAIGAILGGGGYLLYRLRTGRF